MLEIERRRIELGVSMDRLSEVAGLAKRAYAKALYPDSTRNEPKNPRQP